MKRLVVFVFILLAGCHHNSQDTNVVTANFQFSNVGALGTQNAAFFEPGSLFVWDIAANKLDFIETLTLTPKGTTAALGDQTSTSIAGIELSGVPAVFAGKEGLVSASIAGQARFSTSSAYREDYKDTITAISAYVEDLRAQNQDPDLLFHPRDNNFRLVIIRSVLRARASSLSLGGTDASDPNKVVDIALNSPVGEIASVKVRIGTNTACGAPENSASDAASPVCFFNVLVLDPLYQEGDNPRMQFGLGASAPLDKLPAALRALH